MDPLISIITVTFNAQDSIGATLKSLRCQSFRDFEHIVVDGASTDNTLKIIREERGEHVRILSEQDRGLYDAMNKGLNMAKGSYILFLNAGDTFSSSEELERYADAAKKNYKVIYADTQIVNSAGSVLGPRHLSVPRVLTKDSFKQGMLVCHQAFMVRRDIAPNFDMNYRFSSDYDWCIRCLEETTPETCMNLDRVSVNYLSDGLTDKNKIKSLIERFKVMRFHYGTIETVKSHLSFIPRAIKRHI